MAVKAPATPAAPKSVAAPRLPSRTEPLWKVQPAIEHRPPGTRPWPPPDALPAGRPLPFLHRIQASFGEHDLSSVRAHIGRSATEAALRLHARAFASGDHVVFRDPPDLRTTAHEAAHVIQQRAGVPLP